jgi:proteasome beta subunit
MNEDIAKHVLKTGTVTIGIVCKDGIVVGADRRQSYGGQGGGVSYIAGSAKKIVELTDTIIATTAGTASDTRRTLDIIRAELKLKELRTKEKVSVPEVANLLANMVYGNIRTPSMIPSITHFILSGSDEKGTYLFDISPDGYIQTSDTYVVTGSGLMQTHPILDSEYKKNLSLDEAVTLVKKCIRATAGREPSVGTAMDIYIVKKGELKQLVEKETVSPFENTK